MSPDLNALRRRAMADPEDVGARNDLDSLKARYSAHAPEESWPIVFRGKGKRHISVFSGGGEHHTACGLWLPKKGATFMPRAFPGFEGQEDGHCLRCQGSLAAAFIRGQEIEARPVWRGADPRRPQFLTSDIERRYGCNTDFEEKWWRRDLTPEQKQILSKNHTTGYWSFIDGWITDGDDEDDNPTPQPPGREPGEEEERA